MQTKMGWACDKIKKIDVSAGKVMDCKGMRERELIPIGKNYLKVESCCYGNAQSSPFHTDYFSSTTLNI